MRAACPADERVLKRASDAPTRRWRQQTSNNRTCGFFYDGLGWHEQSLLGARREHVEVQPGSGGWREEIDRAILLKWAHIAMDFVNIDFRRHQMIRNNESAPCRTVVRRELYIEILRSAKRVSVSEPDVAHRQPPQPLRSHGVRGGAMMAEGSSSAGK